MMSGWLTAARKNLATKLVLAVAVALLVVLLTQEDILKLGIIERSELAAIDYRFESRGTNPDFKNSATVVIVEISEESFRALPDQWPWPREYYARLLRNLKAAGARAVGLDVILGSADVYAHENDRALRTAIRETGIAVLAGKAEPIDPRFTLITHTENFGNIFFDVDSTLGLVNIRNDADGVYRRYDMFFATSTGLRVPTFGMAVLNKYFGFPALTTAENHTGEFVYAERDIPKYDGTTTLINYYGPSGTFKRIKFVDVIDDETFTTLEEAELGEEINIFSDPDDGYLYDGTFKDKIVLVGSTVPEQHDLFPVAFARGLQKGDNLMYGVEIHANIIESVLRNDFIHRQSTVLEVLLVVLVTVITFLVTSALKGSKTRHHYLVELNGFLFAMAEVFLIGFTSLLLFNKYNYLMATISPILAVVAGYVASTAYHFVVERKQRVLIKTMFSTYVNPSVVDELISNPEKLKLGGERKELTVLFSDIERFTTISEGIPPEQLVALLNEYLSAMTEIIFDNDGTLDKYEGDAIMAFWGAPIPQPDHAVRACRTALRMQQTIARIRTEWQAQGKPLFHVRIGINTGEMVVGNMGGRGKFDYTVIGDSVNLASRLEGANKQYRTGIVVSERTYELVRDAIAGRELDLIAVKGRNEPLRIYELLEERTWNVNGGREELLRRFTEGLALFRAGNWKAARTLFDDLQKAFPEDYPTRLYLERTTLYEKDPPPEDWNGVFTMTTK
jgi:adenylate cyclase